MRQVVHVMGMPVSIDAPLANETAPLVAAFDFLRECDRRFSPYKPDSELCRYQSGVLPLERTSGDFREIMRACGQFEKLTDGYFSACFDGVYNPTGYVKGWTIRRAGDILRSYGVKTYMINAGGDILARSDGAHVWRIGLQHPHDKSALFGTISARNVAVATSGTYVRGQHILDPHTRQPATELLSVTVVGADIVTADVFATAAFAMGADGLDFVARQKGYQALLVWPDLRAKATSGLEGITAVPLSTRNVR